MNNFLFERRDAKTQIFFFHFASPRLCVIFFVIGILFFIVSCGNSKRLSNQNLSLLYNTDETMLHPQYTIFHYSDDSSRFYFHIASNNLLFKKNEQNIFEASVVLNFQLLPSYQSKIILDSGTINLHYQQDSIAD